MTTKKLKFPTDTTPPKDFTDATAVASWIVAKINAEAGSQVAGCRPDNTWRPIECVERDENDLGAPLTFELHGRAGLRHYAGSKYEYERFQISGRYSEGHRMYKFKDRSDFNCKGALAFILEFQQNYRARQTEQTEAQRRADHADALWNVALGQLKNMSGVTVGEFEHEVSTSNGVRVLFSVNSGGIRVQKIRVDVHERPLTVEEILAIVGSVRAYDTAEVRPPEEQHYEGDEG